MPSAGSALQLRRIQPIPRSKIFQHGGQVIRAFLIGAMLVASTPARAEPRSSTLQIRLTVVESCSDDAGAPRCAAPHQRSDDPKVPPQVRDLAPPTTDDSAMPSVTLIY
ncbi:MULTISPECIES: hypothetical protein [Stenotrophomonas maltophilia group]|uniref:hypothetical protein n=1 Tax=Stenotrophomonas TaxID=40323 RepID=UPI001FECA803|nr:MULTISPECIES: hypothetical protein [Stenotrophomonas maltophilia group]MCZ7845994.1 hypothetical protein [Stenotrophomonas maltophilia]MDJ1624673.1 hypothetical protein [Stenotrophomonas sepilia]